ncbi:hypothetical protein Bhyg_14371, partial [Pseudolycoriella hygida]
MSSPSPQQSVKPPSRKQRKASPQPSTLSAFVRKALGKKVVSTSQPRRTVTKRPIEDSIDVSSKSKSLKSNGNQSIASTSSAIVDGNQSVASTSIAISKLSLGVPPPQQSVKPPSRKQRKASPEPSTSSAAVKESLVGKRKALPQSGESGGCQAIIRLTDVDVSFLEHDQHDLQKPVDSETNNWRKIQNANSRYDMSTVKLKLRSLLVDGFHRRRRKHKKILGKFDAEYQEDRQQGGGDEPSQKNSDFMKFLESRMKWFGRATNAYMQKPSRALVFYLLNSEVVFFSMAYGRRHIMDESTDEVQILAYPALDK